MFTSPELLELKTPLARTIELAQALYPDADQAQDFSLDDLPDQVGDALKWLQSKEYLALKDFLNSLSDEVVLGMMTVMYVGRDNEEEDAKYKKALYEERFQEFADWKKEHAINQMMGKAPLAEYLQRGIQLLF